MDTICPYFQHKGLSHFALIYRIGNCIRFGRGDTLSLWRAAVDYLAQPLPLSRRVVSSDACCDLFDKFYYIVVIYSLVS